MELTDKEVLSLFKLKKLQISNLTIDFPQAGNAIEIELSSEDKRYKFLADVNRKGHIDSKKATYQLRHNQVFVIRRLDLNGNHVNPVGPAPFDYLQRYEGYKFQHEDHLHIYLEGWGARWALPLTYFPELEISSNDDLYDKMTKFFNYCNIVEYKVRKILFV